MWPDGSPTGEQAAAWLFDELERVGWPQKPEAYHEILDTLHVPILQAGVLRGFRLTNNTEEIENVVVAADSIWLLSRALTECFKARKRDDDYHRRISSLANKNPLAAHWCPRNILKNSEPAKHHAATESKKEERSVSWLEYAQVAEALSGGSLPSGTLVLHPLSSLQVVESLAAADPSKDPRARIVPKSPQMVLTGEGYRVGGTRVEGPPTQIAETKKRLRPALVASLPVGNNPGWHRKALARNGSNKEYLVALIESIALRKDRGRLAHEFEVNGDLLLNYFDDIQWLECCRDLIDERQTIALMPFVDVGTDQVLASMCRIASWVEGAGIDRFLNALFLRWFRRFDQKERRVQHNNNRHIWRAFGSLSHHPRFPAIPDYDLRLMELLPCQLAWYNRREIVDILCKCPRAYISLETRLLQSAPFEHFAHDEVDRLDDACQELFRNTSSTLH